MNDKEKLLSNIDKIHTTSMGIDRIKKNLNINVEDVVCFCKNKILDKNFVCRQGEIDIIALKDGEIIFIEVKTRKSLECGLPSEAVNKEKKKHIYKSAEYYLYSRNLEKEFVRIDVIEVYEKNRNYKINHIKQAIDS